jgi:membrane protease YdiL (CAAX protease family)
VTARRRSPLRFVVLLVVLSVPFQVFGTAPLPFLPVNLPVGGLQAICPAVAAILLVAWENGWAGVRHLLRRTFDPRGSGALWYALAILGMPVVLTLSYATQVLAGSQPPPPDISIATTVVFAAAFLLSAATEEIGWSGYLLEPLRERMGALPAALLIGVIWGAWHLVGWFFQAHHTLTWTAGQFIGSVAARVLIVWLCGNGRRSLLPAVLFHAMINVGEFAYPRYGSHYDPVITAAFLLVSAAVVAVQMHRTNRHDWSPRLLGSHRG